MGNATKKAWDGVPRTSVCVCVFTYSVHVVFFNTARLPRNRNTLRRFLTEVSAPSHFIEDNLPASGAVQDDYRLFQMGQSRHRLGFGDRYQNERHFEITQTERQHQRQNQPATVGKPYTLP